MQKKMLIGILIVLTGMSSSLAFAGLNELIQYHFHYASQKGILTARGANAVAQGASDDLWFLFDQAESFLQTNLPLMLESTQRAEDLATYLSDGAFLVQSLAYQQNRLTLELQQISSQTKSCESQLERANQLFTTSLKNNNENWFYQAVDQAKSARSCLGEQRVLQNAVQNLLNKVRWNQAQIEPRLTYLKNNQNLIIKHYDILKPSLLAELYKISVRLEWK